MHLAKSVLLKALRVSRLMHELMLIYPQCHDFHLVLNQVMEYATSLLATTETQKALWILEVSLRHTIVLVTKLSQKEGNYFGGLFRCVEA